MRSISLFLILAILFAVSIDVWAMRDPTKSPSFDDQSSNVGVFNPQTDKLTSTLISPSRKVATINGQVVAEGDTYKEAKVQEIESGSVLLNFEGKTYRLSTSAPSIRRNSR